MKITKRLYKLALHIVKNVSKFMFIYILIKIKTDEFWCWSVFRSVFRNYCFTSCGYGWSKHKICLKLNKKDKISIQHNILISFSSIFCKIWTGLPVNIFNVSLNYNILSIRKKLNELQADNQYKIWLYIFLVIFFLHASVVLSVSSCENSWAYIQNRHVLNFH